MMNPEDSPVELELSPLEREQWRKASGEFTRTTSEMSKRRTDFILETLATLNIRAEDVNIAPGPDKEINFATEAYLQLDAALMTEEAYQSKRFLEKDSHLPQTPSLFAAEPGMAVSIAHPNPEQGVEWGTVIAYKLGADGRIYKLKKDFQDVDELVTSDVVMADTILEVQMGLNLTPVDLAEAKEIARRLDIVDYFTSLMIYDRKPGQS